MPIRPASAKAKGRLLQQLVRDKILAAFPKLHEDDVRSTSMGAQGVDVQLSPAAQKLFPHAVECKNLASSAAYGYYLQAVTHSDTLEPLVVLKVNRQKPIVMVDLDYYMELVKNSGQRKK
jgi:hypothetical protein